MSTEAGEPRTEAGKALIEEWFPGNGDGLDAIELGDFRASIAAIEAEAGQLDRAWREAEAALPEGWWVYGVNAVAVPGTGGKHLAAAHGPRDETRCSEGIMHDEWPKVIGIGPTPTAALQALTLALRDKAAGR